MENFNPNSQDYHNEEIKINELSDREININLLNESMKRTKRINYIYYWVAFIGWVVLIGIAFNIIMALGLLSL
jgi:hypothetical protein|tara:strand:- start:997 stop:1215 length:219 start_codon:yes stop_codon:yes gene_type:complete